MSKRRFHVDGSQPAPGQIFVFGSNLSGFHGGGAAKAAHRFYGAVWGVAVGRMGHSYAIPTVQHGIAGPLSVAEIGDAVAEFMRYAVARPHLSFFVTRIGCGLAGHKDEAIAPMFKDAPLNCSLPEPWREFVEA